VDTIIVVIQIGNSDDKLPQKKWSEYVGIVHQIVQASAKEVHFFGGSPNWHSWQNVCLVIEMNEDDYTPLCSELLPIRKHFKQDSIAITRGETIFL
jgi:hypothetical protein